MNNDHKSNSRSVHPPHYQSVPHGAVAAFSDAGPDPSFSQQNSLMQKTEKESVVKEELIEQLAENLKHAMSLLDARRIPCVLPYPDALEAARQFEKAFSQPARRSDFAVSDAGEGIQPENLSRAENRQEKSKENKPEQRSSRQDSSRSSQPSSNPNKSQVWKKHNHVAADSSSGNLHPVMEDQLSQEQKNLWLKIEDHWNQGGQTPLSCPQTLWNSLPRYKQTDMVEQARMLIRYFHGRHDAYARQEYVPSLDRLVWKPVCAASASPFCYWNTPELRADAFLQKKDLCENCPRLELVPIHKMEVIDHMKGYKGGKEYRIAIYPLFADQTCRFAVFEFSAVEARNITSQEVAATRQEDFAASVFRELSLDEKRREHQEVLEVRREVLALACVCEELDIPYIMEPTADGLGYHLWIFFTAAVPARTAREFGALLLVRAKKMLGIPKFVHLKKMLPDRDSIHEGELDTPVMLPMQGAACRKGWSGFVDLHFHMPEDPWQMLKNTGRISLPAIQEKIQEWRRELTVSI